MSIALSKDATLLGQMQTIAAADLDTLFSPAFNLEGKMTALMLRWAGVDGVTPGSRGAFFDAQKLGFLEKILGTSFTADVCGAGDDASLPAWMISTSALRHSGARV